MMDRRELLRAAAAGLAVEVVAAAGVAVSPAARAAGELHVLNWQGYRTDEAWAVKLFEERHGVKVVHDNFNSEQEMLTKLRTSPGTYDVVLINSAFTEQAAKEDRKSTRLNSSHIQKSRMPSSA